MNTLWIVTLCLLAAAMCCGAAVWMVADLFNIPDSFPKKEREKQERPILLRSGVFFTAAGFIMVIALKPLL